MDRNELRDRLKPMLQQYLQEKGLPTDKPFRCVNPAHEDKHPSMSYYSVNNTCRCFACGAVYDVFDLIQQDYDCGYVQSVEIANKKYGDMMDSRSVDKTKTTQKTQSTVKPKITIKKEEKSYSLLNKEAVKIEGGFRMDYSSDYKKWGENLTQTDYLIKRGISMETARKHNIGYDPDYQAKIEDADGNRTVKGAIVIPTSDESYIVRPTTDDSGIMCKYRKKGATHIFNGGILTKTSDPVFVTEGEIDAMSIEEIGYPAVALGGVNNVNMFVEHLKAKNIKCELILAMDNDEAGRKATSELAAKLDDIGIKYSVAAYYDDDHLYKDPNEALVKDRDYLNKSFENYYCLSGDDVKKAKDRLHQKSTVPNIDDFIKIVKGKKIKSIPTGFKGLDKVSGGGLRCGTYVLGAISSCGKTTFAQQMASQIAASGVRVLYFGFEMNVKELISKNVARIIQLNRLKNGIKSTSPITAGEMLYDGDYKKHGPDEEKEIDDAIKLYRESIASNLSIISRTPGINGRMSVDDIRNEVMDQMKALRTVYGDDAKMVVMIDYLQLVAPQNDRSTDKMAIDYNIASIESIAQEFGIPIVIISSLNRCGYDKSVGMDSYKESGNIEYSADQLWGLQYSGVEEKGFDLAAAKKATPRKVEITILKQRLGPIGEKIEFDYYPACDLFLDRSMAEVTDESEDFDFDDDFD